MQLSELPTIEMQAIELLLQGNEMHMLREQLDLVKVVHRTESGAGIYVVFELNQDVVPLDSRASFHVADVFATSEKCDEIGFILFVKEGLIEYLEGYVYSDVYPSYEECNFSLTRQSS